MSSVRTMLPESNPSPPLPALAVMAAAQATRPGEEGRRVWDSCALLGEESEALIVHRGQTYRLRLTKQGKLILYK